VSHITGLFLAKFNLLPDGQRIFIRTVQQINGWRGAICPTPSPPPVGQAPPQAGTTTPISNPMPSLYPPMPRHIPLYTPCKPPVYPLYSPSI
jgi:hypothetical protein